MSAFGRHVGIDYSGARSADASLKGLRAYICETDGEVREVTPPDVAGRYWSRRGLARWLAELLTDAIPTVVGVDHAFSFPRRYFEAHDLTSDWSSFLEDFLRHWPTHESDVTVESVRRGQHGAGSARAGNSRWRRLTDLRSPGAKSAFHFDVPGSVAKSTHAGLPWLWFLRQQLGAGVHFWPFDGWHPPRGRSVVAEAYPAMWSSAYPSADRTPDQHDAFSVACWLRDADRADDLGSYFDPDRFSPSLTSHERATALAEGWILGVR